MCFCYIKLPTFGFYLGSFLRRPKTLIREEIQLLKVRNPHWISAGTALLQYYYWLTGLPWCYLDGLMVAQSGSLALLGNKPTSAGNAKRCGGSEALSYSNLLQLLFDHQRLLHLLPFLLFLLLMPSLLLLVSLLFWSFFFTCLSPLVPPYSPVATVLPYFAPFTLAVTTAPSPPSTPVFPASPYSPTTAAHSSPIGPLAPVSPSYST